MTRATGVGWNLSHNVDLQMLSDIADEFGSDAWASVQLNGLDIAIVLHAVINRAKRAEWS